MKKSRKVSSFPRLIKEWDYQNNPGLDPNELSYGSKKVVNWICEEKHRWPAAIVNRTHRGSNCPYCAGQRVIEGVNDLLSQYPEVAKSWSSKNPIGPEQVCIRTAKKYLWECKEGHEWSAQVFARTRGSDCPYCKGKRVMPGVNDLATLHPDVAAKWDYDENGKLTPGLVRPHSRKEVGWVCENGHKWKERICYRIRNKCNCPVCDGYYIVPGVNDFATLFPDVVSEWDYEKNKEYNPHEIAPHAGIKVGWICKEGHSWDATVDARTLRKTMCPYCQGNKAVAGENDIATLYPELVKEWDEEKNEFPPTSLKAMSGVKPFWKCKKGHSWQAAVYQRICYKTGCPYCAKKRLIVGENDLATRKPELAAKWDYENNNGLTPMDVTLFTDKRVAWVCERGHHWKAKVRTMNSCTGNGCPYCSGKKPIVGENDFASRNPEIVKEWDYEKNRKKPEEYTYGSEAKVWWKCALGHSWRTAIRDRTKGTNCPECWKTRRRSLSQ